MHQPWSNTRYWLAACLAAAAAGTVQPLSAQSPPATGEKLVAVRGEMVADDAPVPYRLPLIGLCDPADEARITGQAGDQASQPVPVSAASLPFPASSSGLTAQLLPATQRGYKLAQRGAFFAARTEYIQVLRRVAQAKDAASGTDQFSTALAAGMRAMDEAEDFVPQGAQLEGELDVRGVASAHRTPVLREHTESVLPHDAVALYHKFAQERLARAALDEQAGSMALYGLGKVYSRLAEQRDDDVQCVRGAMTMYSAAIDACPSNNLAANELGVLLCRTGHPAQAVESFTRAIDVAPTATAYHNLAVAQQKLNLQGEASANEMESQRLAAMERATNTLSRHAGIQWVTPAEMARVSQPARLAPAAATEPAVATRPSLLPKHKWR